MRHIKPFKAFENLKIDGQEVEEADIVEEVTMEMAKKWVDDEVKYFEDCDGVDQGVEDMLYDIEYFVNDRKKSYNEEELKEYMKTKWNENFSK